MKNSEILTPGEKIKKLRNQLDIKQHEITGDQITRNLISAIENGKASLTTSVAKIISNNINNISRKKGLDILISSDYLLEDVEMQVNKIADDYICFLEANEDNDLIDMKEVKLIEDFLLNYNVPEKKSIIYDKIGNIYKKQRDYYNSYTYYIKAFENSTRLLKDVKLFKLLTNIAFCCIKLNKFREAIDFNKLAIAYSDHLPCELKFDIIFNNALAYKKLNMLDKAIEELHTIENIENYNIKDRFDILTLKANCYKGKKYYNDALEIHKSLLEYIEGESLKFKGIVLCNLIEIYCILLDYKNVKLYLGVLLPSISHLENNRQESVYLPHIHNEIAVACSLLGDLELAKEHYLKSLQWSKEYRSIDVIDKSINQLFDLYLKTNKTSEIEDLKYKLFELLSLELVKKDNPIIFKMLKYYNEQEDKMSISNITNFILNNY